MPDFSRLTGLAAATTLLVSFGASSASAGGYGNVYLSFGSSICSQAGTGGKVIGIQGAVGNTWSTAWDTGDNIVYPRVVLGVDNVFNGAVYCSRAGQRLPINVVDKHFVPTRSGQKVRINSIY